MEEHGVVIEEKGRTVLIRAEQKSTCESCVSKSSCQVLGDSEMLIEAENPVGARVGDRVVFSAGAASIMKAGVLLYLVPVLCFIFGVVLGQMLSADFFPDRNPDLVSGLFGAFFLAVAFVGLKLYNRLIEKGKAHLPTIHRVV